MLGLHVPAVERQPQRKDESLMEPHARAEFLLRAAHDIRSPITTIIGYAELLEQTFPDGDERRTYVDAMQRAARRLQELAERLAAAAEGGP